MINDIKGFNSHDAINAVAGTDAGLCVMHMQNLPANMQSRPDYHDVVTDVEGFLQHRIDALLSAGIKPENICIDPVLVLVKRWNITVHCSGVLTKYRPSWAYPCWLASHVKR
jgi:dihydropteroate synthase